MLDRGPARVQGATHCNQFIVYCCVIIVISWPHSTGALFKKDRAYSRFRVGQPRCYNIVFSSNHCGLLCHFFFSCFVFDFKVTLVGALPDRSNSEIQKEVLNSTDHRKVFGNVLQNISANFFLNPQTLFPQGSKYE